MRTFAITIELKNDPAIIERYMNYHKNVWPEVRAAVAKLGIRDVKIFQLGTRLVQIFCADDDFSPRRDMQKYTADPKAMEWDEMMREFQKPVAEAKKGEWWAEMSLVYDSNW